MDHSWVEDERQYPESLQVPGDLVARSSRNASSNRAQSTIVHPSPTSSQSHSRRHRVSHQIASSPSSHHSNSNQDPLASQPAFDIMQHPAALSYASAHPNRTIPKFGPYLLLQTLGEGEFGKVKLGLHNQWGEEVAVKLIRRGSVDSSVRMSKIEREIEVLRTLHHPNIVHLYDVIETDKYIGIILEYASGGELFDHILAHRYLKERDACKLFAQLISAVWYLHQKKIVHRDLKLENLLLDRHRNVIVTDFGFANRFEHRADDLMQTSCGSPCYAAPELVISEGLYVGSAVDIWSCGVILYAMLAGYLPFDDDPANPEGDNINLLYKYILSTQLTFPDYVSAEARDLLSKMLVPDPQFRADLQTVMSHEWLSPYANLFGRSIDEYENVAQEQQTQKRANYQRQIREREREIQRSVKAQQREQHRQHAHTDPRSTKSTGGYAGQVPMEVEDPDMFMVPTPSVSNRRAVASAIIMPTSTGPMEDLIMTGEPQRNGDERARKESRARSGKGKETDHREKKSAGPGSKGGGRPPPGGFRHTIQLEYDDGAEQAEAMPPTPSSRITGKRRHDEEDVVMQNAAESSSRSRRESSGPRLSQVATPVPPMPGPLPMQQVPKVQASPSTTTRAAGPSTLHTLVRNAATEPALSTYIPTHESRTSLHTPPTHIVISTDVPVPAASSTPLQSPVANSPAASTTSTPSSSSSKPSKHGRGMSIDRFNISKLLHGKDSSGEEKKDKEESKKRPSRKGSETSSNAGAGMAGIGASGGIPTPPTSAALTSTSNLSVASGGATAASTLDQTSTGKGTSKRRGGKALSLVVDPITRMKESRSKNRASVAVGSEKDKPLNTPLSANPTPSQVRLTAPPAKPEVSTTPNTPSWRLPTMFNYSPAPPKNPTPADPVKGGMVTSTGASSKSQGVMDWFRKKSLAKQERRGADTGRAEGTKTPTPDDPQMEKDAKTPTVSSFREAQAAKSGGAPAVVVTAENGSVYSGGSQGSGGSRKRDKVIEAIKTVATPTASVLVPISPTRPALAYNKLALRLHDGPVDPSTLFSAPPAEIVAHVLGILRAMGIESIKESEFKYRCIRPKRKKSGTVVREASGSSNGITAFNSVGSAASNGVDRRGLPAAPSSFTSAGMFKIFSRRTASQPTTVTVSPSLSFDNDDEGFMSRSATSTEPTTPSSQTQGFIEPIYGPPNDQGDEVRFSVEVTRIDRLDDLLSLDIRRLKGHLKSYKFLYDTIRERCNLPR